MFSFDNRRNKAKHIDKLQQALPYEAPINVRQIANLAFGQEGLTADYYEPMALTRADTLPDKSAMHVAVLLYDDPYRGSKDDMMPLAMEMARRGLAVFALALGGPTQQGAPFLYRQVADVFDFLADLRVDRHHLNLHPMTYGAPGNSVVLMGCGTGALVAGVCMRLYHNARMREHFAAACPSVSRYFGMGNTVRVDMTDLVKVAGFVSMSGYLCPAVDPSNAELDAWLGRGWQRAKVSGYLDFGRWSCVDWPPVLMVTAGADTTRPQTMAVEQALPAEVRHRLLDLPREDDEAHVLENLFWARYPLWAKSKDVNAQIVAFCKSL